MEEMIPYVIITNELKKETFNSRILLGNIILNSTMKLNWFHRSMIKLILGIKIEKVKEEK